MVSTAFISLAWIWGAIAANGTPLGVDAATRLMVAQPNPTDLKTYFLPWSVFFYSAFSTSVWLWLYATSVLASRLLLRMNNGVGFLLRVTDG